jgi:hypothetical protein
MIRNLIHWFLDYPKCEKGGYCNSDISIEFKIESGRFFEETNVRVCSKCRSDKETVNKKFK